MEKETLNLRHVKVIRYITPLREGGSLPAIVDADDGFRYVLKFRGAGQGMKALISELIGGEIAYVLGLKVPELVFADLDEAFGRTEGDEEIQDLLKWSAGLNLGMHYLSGALTFDPAANEIDSKTASEIVWLDAFLMNVDRTHRNANLLIWHNELWLIDHGAALYFHHSWEGWEDKAMSAFPLIKDHVLLKSAADLERVNDKMKTLVNPEVIAEIVNLIPENWLEWRDVTLDPDEIKEVYRKFLTMRLQNADRFIKEAEDARTRLI